MAAVVLLSGVSLGAVPIVSVWGTFVEVDEDSPVGAPRVYRGSHVIPEPGHEAGGFVDAASIAGWIRRGGDDAVEDDDGVWPWLRLTVRGEPTWRNDYRDTVVLDAEQVRWLRDQLSVWLARCGAEDGDWQRMAAYVEKRWSAG